MNSKLISAISEWKDERYYQVQVKSFNYAERDGTELNYEWTTFSEKFDSVKAILASPQWKHLDRVHGNIRILITSKEYLVLRKKGTN